MTTVLYYRAFGAENIGFEFGTRFDPRNPNLYDRLYVLVMYPFLITLVLPGSGVLASVTCSVTALGQYLVPG